MSRSRTKSNMKSCASFRRAFLFAIFAGLLLFVGSWGASSRADIVLEKEEPANETVEGSAVAAIADVQVGICGTYKNGFQTQVVVSWNADAASPESVELETIDSDGTPFVSKRAASEDEKKAGRLETRFIFPKANAKLTVRLLDASGVCSEEVWTPKGIGPSSEEGSASKTFAYPAASSKPIYLTIGSDNLGFSEAFAEMRWKEDRRPVVVNVGSFDELPSDPRSYEAVDKLFIATSKKDVFNGVTAESPKIRAIEDWTARGGNVVILADENAIPLLADGGALNSLSPGKNVAPQAQEFRSVNALVTELQHVKNLAMTGSKSNPFIRVPVVSDLKSDAIVEMQEMETPLLVARPVGLGSVVYFAGDLSAAPLANWSGRGRLMLKILGVDPDKNIAKPASSNFVKRGYLDLSGQLRSALDSYDGVKIAPFSLAAVLIFAYLLAIAPIDWFIAKKVVKRPNITWITFPIIAVAFCAIAVWIFTSRTPKDPVLNQVDLVDVDMASGMTRDSSWFGFYSPVGARYDLEFGPKRFNADTDAEFGKFDLETAQTDVSPLTLAGDGIGGEEQKSYVSRVWDKAYATNNLGSAASITDVPLTTRSSKSFFGRWTARLQNVPETPALSDDGLTIRGSVLNPFDVPIYSAYVIYQGGAYALGTLAPGVTKLERGMTRVEPTRVLNEHQSSVPASKQKSWDITTYNNSSTRAPYILRTASFYDFGGGEDNFGISKRLQRDVDLSELIRCGRAVVFGTIVDSYSEEYGVNEDLARKSADAIEVERLNRKLAEQKGEVVENALEAAAEKYGLTGSSEEFEPTTASWSAGADSQRSQAARRTVVVRLIVPMSRGALNE